MAKKKMEFEEAMDGLEAIVDRLEQEELSLDEAVKLYKEGLSLFGVCRQKLTDAEGEILMLKKEAGLITEEPFKAEENDE